MAEHPSLGVHGENGAIFLHGGGSQEAAGSSCHEPPFVPVVGGVGAQLDLFELDVLWGQWFADLFAFHCVGFGHPQRRWFLQFNSIVQLFLDVPIGELLVGVGKAAA